MSEESFYYTWYKKILAKPEAYRRRLALLLTGIIGIVIVAVWLFIISYQFQNIFESDQPETKNSTIQIDKNNQMRPLKDNNAIFKND